MSDPKPRAADRILASARDLFYRQGIRAVGVDEIVAQAGVTKPSLYRSYGSKDDLAADYLRAEAEQFWGRFDSAAAGREGDARAQLIAYFKAFSGRAARPGFRGCGLSNAAVEYPQPDHPARREAEAFKRQVRARLTELSARAGARDPAALGDSLMLLMEGVYNAVQLFGPDGPQSRVAGAAEALIDAATG